MKTVSNWLIWLAYSTIVVTWILLFTIGYWSLFDKALPSLNNLEEISRTEVVPGDTVKIRYSVNRYRACHATYMRVLDGQSPQSPTFVIDRGEREITEAEVGKQVDVNVKFVIPYDILPGYYEMYTRINYACNPMQRFFPIVVDTPKAILHVLSRQEVIEKELQNAK